MQKLTWLRVLFSTRMINWQTSAGGGGVYFSATMFFFFLFNFLTNISEERIKIYKYFETNFEHFVIKITHIFRHLIQFLYICKTYVRVHPIVI